MAPFSLSETNARTEMEKTEMQIDAGALLTAAGMVIGTVVWLVRLEGRQNLTDARFEDLKSDLKEIKSDVKAIREGK